MKGIKKMILAGLIALSSYMPAMALSGRVTNMIGKPENGALVAYRDKYVRTDGEGYFNFNEASVANSLESKFVKKTPLVSIYDLKGRKIKNILSERDVRGRDDSERKIAAGAYILRSDGFVKKFLFTEKNEFPYESSEQEPNLLKSSFNLNFYVFGTEEFPLKSVEVADEDSFYDVKVNEYPKIIADDSARIKRVFLGIGKELGFPLKFSDYIKNDGNFAFVEMGEFTPVKICDDSIMLNSSNIEADLSKHSWNMESGFSWNRLRYELVDKDSLVSYLRKTYGVKGSDSAVIDSFNNLENFADHYKSLARNLYMSKYYFSKDWFDLGIVSEQSIYQSCPFFNDDGSDFRKMHPGENLEQIVLDFVSRDTTDRNEYIIPDYVCYHFSQDFMSNARREGIPVYFVGLAREGYGHAINGVLVGDDALNFSDWLFIEPQTDGVINFLMCGDFFPCSTRICVNFQPNYLVFNAKRELISHTNPYSIFGINFPTAYDSGFNLKREIEEKVIPKVDYVIR